MKKIFSVNDLRKGAIFLILILEIIAFSLLSPRFFALKNFTNILRQVSFIMIIAVGEALVLLTGGLDLSVGYQVTFINILVASLIVKLHVPFIWAIVIGLIATVFIGFVNGTIITLTKMPPMICTLAVMSILEGVSNTMSGGKSIYGFPETFTNLGQGTVFGIPNVVIVAVVSLLFGWIFLNKTYVGRFLFAIGGNENCALLSGIRVDRYKRLAYMMCSFFVGLSGILLLARLNTGSPSNGVGYEFDALTAVVLGGMSVNGGDLKISYIISGVLVIGIMENGFVLIDVGTYTQLIVKGIILIIAVAFDCLQRRERK